MVLRKTVVLLLLLSAAAVSCSNRVCAVDSTMVEEYLADDTAAFANMWYFAEHGPYMPVSSDVHVKDEVRGIMDILEPAAEKFTPMNGMILDGLFPQWKRIRFNVDFIVGSPLRFETYTADSPSGHRTVVMDAGNLSLYDADAEALVPGIRSMLMHEYVHLLTDSLGCATAGALDTEAYRDGFAYLLSFDGKDVDCTDWKQVRDGYFASAADALDKLMRDGTYEPKPAGLAAMCYLSLVYEKDGINGLKRELELGPEGMCRRILSER